jgi:hypothetical protein
VLKFSSRKYLANPVLEIKNVNKNNINKLEIEILGTSETLINIDKDNFNFSNNSNDFVKLENNIIKYYFLNNYTNNQTRAECNFKNT